MTTKELDDLVLLCIRRGWDSAGAIERRMNEREDFRAYMAALPRDPWGEPASPHRALDRVLQRLRKSGRATFDKVRRVWVATPEVKP